jgi:two-component system, sensor histidine kinase and response regulator
MIPRNTRILVVDDIAAMLNLTVSLLRSLGLSQTASATNGQDALRLLKSQPFDVVLADWNMPVMNGLQLLQHIRADPKLARLPFLMITAEADRNRITEAIATGVSGMLIKPYKTAQLEERILKALKSAPLTPSARPSVMPAAPTTAAPSAKNTAGAQANRPTLLIVDDTPDNLQLLVALFRDDYRVKAVNNGARALEICCSDTPPDLVLLDIMMPVMDGFEVARRMREHPSAETIPVIFVTALNTDDARMKGLSLGAIDFVTKPIDPNVLKPRVSNLLRYIGLHKQLQANFDTMEELARLHENVDHMMRHDLKGPLASIIGLAQNLINRQRSPDPESAEQLRLIEASASQLIDLVSVSSKLFSIELGNFILVPEPLPLMDILNNTANALQGIFSSKGVNIEIKTEPIGTTPFVLGEPSLSYSALNNLLKNAFEAAPNGSRIHVTVRDGETVQICLVNQGVVPVEIRDRFFDKYTTHGKPGGSGLGTYSAKRLIEAQNGTIDFTTSDREGTTTLTITLPKAGPDYAIDQQ